MSNIIVENKKLILKSANWLLSTLHEYLIKVIGEKNISEDSIIKKFIQSLDQEYFGIGCVFVEVADYFEQKPNELKSFIDILSLAIQKASNDNRLNDLAETRLFEFKNSLIKYLKELEYKNHS